jgi:GTPase SAR1 family protein
MATGSVKSDPKANFLSLPTRSVELGSRVIQFSFWDIAGQEQFRALTPLYCLGVDIALILYSITNRDSFDSIDFWLKYVSDSPSQDAIVFIVGVATIDESVRIIEREEGQAKAQKCKAEFAEVSSVTGAGVAELFESMMKLLLKREAEQRCDGRVTGDLTTRQPRSSCW